MSLRNTTILTGGVIIEDGGLWWLVPAAVFLFLMAWVTAVQTAVVTTNDSRLKKLSEEGSRPAKRLVKLIKEPVSFVNSMESARIIFLLAFQICFFLSLERVVVGWLSPLMGVGAYLVATLLLLVVSVIICLTVGTIMPKRIGAAKCEKIALSGSAGLVFVAAIMRPVSALCGWMGKAAARLFGVGPDEVGDNVTEEEIRLLVDVGQETGVIEDIEKSMINNVFEFDDRIAGEVMTHRTEMCAVDHLDPLEEVLALAISEGYSRLPVYRDNPDKIIGVLYVKDFLKYVGNEIPADVSVTDMMREAFFVPESISCSELFAEMTKRQVQMAIVADEYGGTAGLVTIEDLLESIVGNIRDEFDDEDDEFARIDDDNYEVDGGFLVSDLEELLDTELPEGDYDTVGGLVLSQLERIPTGEEAAEVSVDELRFKVLEVDNTKIMKVLVTRIPHQKENS